MAEGTAGGDITSAKGGMVPLAFGEKRLKTKDQGTKEMSFVSTGARFEVREGTSEDATVTKGTRSHNELVAEWEFKPRSDSKLCLLSTLGCSEILRSPCFE